MNTLIVNVDLYFSKLPKLINSLKNELKDIENKMSISKNEYNSKWYNFDKYEPGIFIICKINSLKNRIDMLELQSANSSRIQGENFIKLDAESTKFFLENHD